MQPDSPPKYQRGYCWMFSRQIKQADHFVEAALARTAPEPDID